MHCITVTTSTHQVGEKFVPAEKQVAYDAKLVVEVSETWPHVTHSPVVGQCLEEETHKRDAVSKAHVEQKDKHRRAICTEIVFVIDLIYT